MRVCDLIEFLKQFPPEMVVVGPFCIDDGVYGYAPIATMEIAIKDVRLDGDNCTLYVSPDQANAQVVVIDTV